MKLTRSQKTAIGLLGVALVALVIDRTFFSPSEAGAAPVPAAQAAAAAAEPAATGNKQESAPVPDALTAVLSDALISSKLKSLTGVDVEHVRDAFAPSQQWVTAQRPPVATVAPPVHNISADFVAAHRLNAVMASRSTAGGGEAIVDGQFVRVGQYIGSWRLIGVNKHSATFVTTDGSAHATLRLPQ
jgi:hypothetical protein